MERIDKWLTAVAVLARVIALVAAAIAGAIAERDVGVLPAGGRDLRSGLSSKLLGGKAECPPPR